MLMVQIVEISKSFIKNLNEWISSFKDMICLAFH